MKSGTDKKVAKVAKSQTRFLSVSTALLARSGFFQPKSRRLDKLNEGEKWPAIDVPWGAFRLGQGVLGQQHADFLDALLFCSQEARVVAANGGKGKERCLKVVVDETDIRRLLGRSGSFSFQQIEKRYQEIASARLEYAVPGLVGDQAIVTDRRKLLGFSKYEKSNPLFLAAEKSASAGAKRLLDQFSANGGNGRIHALTRFDFGTIFSEILLQDLGLLYDPRPVLSLRHGISKAVARHCQSHRNQPHGGWKLDELLQTVGCDMASAAVRKARWRMGEDAEGLAACGIRIEGGRVHRDGRLPPVGSARPELLTVAA